MALRGHIPWNKGKRGIYSNEVLSKMSHAKRGISLSEEHKKRISLAGRGRKFSQETRRNISESKKGNRNPMFGKVTRGAWKKGHNKGISFSLEHRRKIGESEKREKHWNWKGGIYPINLKIRDSLEYTLWRKAVFERDNFTCQKYGKSGGDLIAHHINNFASSPELRLAIDNGVTLSSKAHKEFHRRYGTKNNTLEQLLEFLRE